MLPSAIRLGDLRRNTLTWCRMTRISACSAIRDRTRPTTAHQIKLHKSLIATILSRFAGDRHQGWVCGRDTYCSVAQTLFRADIADYYIPGMDPEPGFKFIFSILLPLPIQIVRFFPAFYRGNTAF